ncbi:uncharacterized protein LOC107364786 [Tetranychus urticae]|uniref:Uncharacterized protein n=1 Tax=Tetranychus urticae TaxID=32264 RepID=T1KK69_TETUR|nr:uncharacterized protein LOC107364786 [Tetranychus urticae]
MFKLISICVILVTGFLVTSADFDCGKAEEMLEVCGLHLALLEDNEIPLPTNDAEMVEHCGKMFSNLDCIRDFNKKCLKPFPKTLFGMFNHDLRKEMKHRCDKPEGRAEFLKHAECLRHKDKLGPIIGCKNNFIGQLEWITGNVAKSEQTVAACCSFHQAHQCFSDKIEEVCHPITGSGTKEYIDEVIESTVTEAIDYACGKYKTLDHCHEFLDKSIWDKLFAIGKDAAAAGVSLHHRSSITAVVDLLNQFDGESRRRRSIL